MHRRRIYAALIVLGAGMAVASAIALLSFQAASAQCGSQASSCKNCHETQAKDPVNNDGTGWHQSHAFGDFCYICHGGNSQAMDEAAAHTGMVDPMSDIQAACGQCHPNDLQARADVYAAKLGRPATGAAAAPAAATPTAAPAAPAASAPSAPAAAAQPTLSPNNPDLVDYVQRYNEKVLGQAPTNWGNVILSILIVAMVIGGGALVITREGLVRVSFKETRPVTGEYPGDVVDMVPDLAKLKPGVRKSLQKLLKKPAATSSLLAAVDELTKEQDK